MMQQEIKAADRLPTLRDAGDGMHGMGADLEALSALVFSLSHPNAEFEFDHQALRGVTLALDLLAKRAVEEGDRLHEAARVLRSLDRA